MAGRITHFNPVIKGVNSTLDDYGNYWPGVKKYLDELSLSHELFTNSGLVMHFVS